MNDHCSVALCGTSHAWIKNVFLEIFAGVLSGKRMMIH